MTAIQITIEGKDVTMTYEQARSLFFELGDKIKGAREFQEERDNHIKITGLLHELPRTPNHALPIHIFHDLPFLSGNNDWKEPENDHWDNYNRPVKPDKENQWLKISKTGRGSTYLPKLPDDGSVVVIDDVSAKNFENVIADIKRNMNTEIEPTSILKTIKNKKAHHTGGIPWNPRKSTKRR